MIQERESPYEGGIVDIHVHVLPGIDDGPASVEDSLALLRAAADSGVQTIAATPHLRSDFPGVRVNRLADRLAALREQAASRSIAVELVGGAEVSLSWAVEATDEELSLASYCQRGTDLLIETPDPTMVGLGELLAEPRSRGFRVTLAHPERSPRFQRDPSELSELVEQGIRLQIDAAALLSSPRSPAHRLAAKLCREGTAHLIASDGHRAASWRPVTVLADAVAAASALVGPDRARWMVHEAPAAILAGEPLPEPPPLEQSAGGALRRLFARQRP